MDLHSLLSSWRLSLLALLALASHLVCGLGLLCALRGGSRAALLRWALAGLATVCAIGIAAWLFYRQELSIAIEGACFEPGGKGTIMAKVVELLRQNLTLGLLGMALPALVAIGLLARGLLLPAGAPAPGAGHGRLGRLLAAASLSAGGGLLLVSLLRYLDHGLFLMVFFSWWS
ncbi:MAG: hypothetical protein JXR96_09700 [Deltaproteobacteria bacterium]|nr:hypothetical protein [Deltaproteobacteria bacterium]